MAILKFFEKRLEEQIERQSFRYPGREILCKKCAEMCWFFKKFSAKTLHKNALKCAETLQETR